MLAILGSRFSKSLEILTAAMFFYIHK